MRLKKMSPALAHLLVLSHTIAMILVEPDHLQFNIYDVLVFNMESRGV